MLPLWVAVAFCFGLAARQLGLPPLVGFLVAGFVLNGLGHRETEGLDAIAHLGVLLLLFSVGLKVRLRNVLRPEVWGTTMVHLALVAGLLLPVLLGLVGIGSSAGLLLAIGLGFSSTVVAAKALDEKRELRAFHGRVAIGVLVIQDLVAVALLTIGGHGTMAWWALALLALPLLRPAFDWLLARTGHDELLLLFGMLLALAAGGLVFEHAGLSPELGALLMGALLANHPRAHELATALWGLKEAFLVAFFLQIGMSGLPDLPTVLAALALVALLPVKAVLFFFLLIAFRLRARTSFLAAVALASYSEFALIVAKVAVDDGLLDAHWLLVLALAVAVSFALAAPLNRAAHLLYQRYESRLCRFETRRRHEDDEPLSVGSAEIVIVGMGRVGTGAYEFLRARGLRVVGLDSDPGKVERHLHQSRRVVYADAEDPGLWHRLNLDGVRAVMLAVPDLEAKVAAVASLRQRGYPGMVCATNVWAEEAEQVLDAGATVTFNYFDQAGVGFAERVLESLEPVAPKVKT
ncbi:MAG: cation:proton antiporter [Ectothiorhodospiraceae bacterium]|nr:cation:proton antiporter [Ectothiorhodospiraceae bacterium]